jgi:hypothetical protein
MRFSSLSKLDPVFDDIGPVWSPDGRHLVYSDLTDQHASLKSILKAVERNALRRHMILRRTSGTSTHDILRRRQTYCLRALHLSWQR